MGMDDLNLERKTLKVLDSRAAEILLDTQRVRLLEPFIHQPCTISKAAREREQSVKKMAYWVDQFMQLGLVKEVTPALSRRAATYLTTAPHFVLENLDAFLLREYINEQFLPLWELFAENLHQDSRRYAELWDYHVFADETGDMIRHFAPAWERQEYRYDPATVYGDNVNTWALLPLTREDASDLMGKLEQLLAEYIQRADRSPEPKVYLVHVGVVRHHQH